MQRDGFLHVGRFRIRCRYGLDCHKDTSCLNRTTELWDFRPFRISKFRIRRFKPPKSNPSPRCNNLIRRFHRLLQSKPNRTLITGCLSELIFWDLNKGQIWIFQKRIWKGKRVLWTETGSNAARNGKDSRRCLSIGHGSCEYATDGDRSARSPRVVLSFLKVLRLDNRWIEQRRRNYPRQNDSRVGIVFIPKETLDPF